MLMEETIPKFQRIQELAIMGFNTPRVLCVPPGPYFWEGTESVSQLREFMKQVEHQGFVNVRTYERTGVTMETCSGTHYTHVAFREVESLLRRLSKKGIYAMVDLENPEHGMYAGNVQLWNTPDIRFTVEYCYNPDGGAMVRNIEKSVSGALEDKRSLRVLPRPIVQAINTAYTRFRKAYKSVILEWSYTLVPAGTLYNYYLWWEYRNLKAPDHKPSIASRW